MMQMNNAPLYRNYWGFPSQQQRYNKVPSKVVTIPVHFVGSERSRDDSAIKIQKVVRGFLVRITLKRIMGISVEVDKVEARVYDSLEVIKRDQKERVRVSETIMNLLLKLDSVRVLNHCYGVRECRKSVTKKAIALQEMVDQIVESNVDEESHHGDEVEDGEMGENESNCVVKEENEGNCVVREENGSVGDSQGEKMEGLRDEENKESEGEECVGEASVGTSLIDENNCVVKEEVEEEEEEEHDDEDGGGVVRKEGRHREMLERMMEDNEKMMAMMAQLYEKNEMQTKLLTSLSERVEQLERAFTCEKLRRCSKRRKQQKQTQPKNNGSI